MASRYDFTLQSVLEGFGPTPDRLEEVAVILAVVPYVRGAGLFAGTLSRGAHVAIEGEIRSDEYQREVPSAASRFLSRSGSGKSASTPC